MEHDSSSRTGYHEPEPVNDGREDDYWDDSAAESDLSSSINLIWAEAKTSDGQLGAIGNAGGMPWHLSEDLKRFADLTVSHPVIMGRKTWESLGEKYRPLPNRDNIVVSRNPQYKAPGATVVETLNEAIGIAKEEAIPDDGIDRSEIWVIGGGTLFKECLAEASRAYITQIDTVVPADVFAPDIRGLVETGQWKLADESEWRVPQKDSSKISRFRYVRYDRVALHHVQHVQREHRDHKLSEALL